MPSWASKSPLNIQWALEGLRIGRSGLALAPAGIMVPLVYSPRYDITAVERFGP